MGRLIVWGGLVLVLALVLTAVVKVVAGGDSVWHVSERAPLPPVPVALPDDGSWPAWKAGMEALAAGGADAGALRELLSSSEGAPDPDRVAAIAPPPEALAAMPDPLATRGLRVPLTALDAPSELPREAMAAPYAWLLRAWEQNEDPDAAEADLLRALQFGVVMQHSGESLVANMLGIHAQRRALSEAEEMVAAGLPAASLDRLATAVEASRALGPGVGAGIRGDCTMIADGFETLLDQAQTPGTKPLPGPAVGYSPNRTVSFLLHQCRVALANVDRPPEERQPIPPSPPLSGLGYVDNPVGRILLRVGSVPSVRFLESVDRLGEERAAFLDLVAQAPPDGGKEPSTGGAPDSSTR